MSLLQTPDNWNSEILESLLVHIIGGDWGKAPDHQEKDYQTVACIRGSEFRNWTKESGRTAVLRKVKVSSLDKRSLFPGDILLEISGGGPEQPVGRTVLINQVVLDQFDIPVIGTNFLRLLRPSAALDQRFLNKYLEFFYNSGEVIKYQGGSNNLRNLKFKEYSQISVPVPPLAEQKVIADTLDTLLAQVENTKARLERIPQILKRFRQSVLAAAVSGRLTEEWRKVSNCSLVDETLADIAFDRAQETKGKTKTPQAHLKQEESPIPDSWKWVSLDSLAKKIVDGTHHTPTYIDSGVPFISVKDIKGGKVSFDNTKFISEEEHSELSKRCPVEEGDLLITKSGTIGRTALVRTSLPFSIFVSVALIKPASSKVNVRYVDLALQKWINEIDVSSRIVGSAIKNLHLRDMKVLAIPFAPIEEQTEIVRRVDQLFAHADRIEQQVNKALARVNNLTQSILAKAFRGELTEQWRKDNPELISGENSAEALLERVNAEREAIKPKRQKQKA
ncbi:restriction endonuclease subunit S [Marinobacter nauticus]|uniref:restriction endonuclease subunit S n=1 Tax=Marinobacter nauticus TaxID=2743 RepID=UPI003737051C